MQHSRPLRQKSLLAERDVPNQRVVIAPAEAGATYFDDTRQTLVWPVQDNMHQNLYLELSYTRHTVDTLGWLEQCAGQPWEPGHLVVVKYQPTPRGLVAEPVTLIDSTRLDTTEAISSLYFRQVPNQTSSITADQPQTLPVPDQLVRLTAPLREFWQWITCQAERGIGVSHGTIVAPQLD
ncbi:hypothetical protein [Pseudomonas sp. JZ134]|uniref:hypothetical protein n=1 Tax=Pseudomonas sp. JZ134 TaxID=2806615 RepID=UPI003DA10273